jgi:flagellar hook-basal body complex protein FliE
MTMATITIPPALRPVESLDPSRSTPGAAPAGGASFADALGQALSNVEQAQTSSDAAAQEVALGGGNLHETALAMEKADITMRFAVKVRNKLVEAYQDIMRMSV